MAGRRAAGDGVADLLPATRMRIFVISGEPACHGRVGNRLQRIRFQDCFDARTPARGCVCGRSGLGVAQHQGFDAARMPDAQRLADHAADRQTNEMALPFANGIEQQNDVVSELIDGVRSGRGTAATVAAQIHAQRAVAGDDERRHLFRPHAEVGGKRMRKDHDRRLLRSDDVIGNIASNEREQHDVWPSAYRLIFGIQR